MSKNDKPYKRYSSNLFTEIKTYQCKNCKGIIHTKPSKEFGCPHCGMSEQKHEDGIINKIITGLDKKVANE